MMLIDSKLIPLSSLNRELNKYTTQYFNDRVSENLIQYLNLLRNRIRYENLNVLIEYPYVDKQYRDSYYFYYSTKHREIPKNSIRISFFSNDIKIEDFRDPDRFSFINSNYFGFITIRPIGQHQIGRSLLSPTLFRDSENYSCELSNYESLINGVILSVRAFPYSSQDGELLTCSQATIINLLEYFGNKYQEYYSILPSQIFNILSKNSTERVFPNEGLTYKDVSYVLKSFGLSPKIYNQDVINDLNRFMLILNIYIDSGIPVLGILTRKELYFGHIILIIGRERLNNTIDRLQENIYNINNFLSYYIKKHVIIDDNQPPYIFVSYRINSNSINYYKNILLKEFNLNSFIVPLYQKIYLDAELIIDIAQTIIEEIFNIPKIKTDIIIRPILLMSKSYKSFINLNVKPTAQGLQKIKEFILSTSMPKFIWVIEITEKTLLKKRQINGLAILDATETSFILKNLLLFTFYNNKLFYLKNSGQLMKNSVDNERILLPMFEEEKLYG